MSPFGSAANSRSNSRNNSSHNLRALGEIKSRFGLASPTNSLGNHSNNNSQANNNQSTNITTARRQLIIGVSANSDHNTMEAAGVDAFIPKPFTIQIFNETYEALLQSVALLGSEGGG
eukprot:gene33011-40742_t